jgi:hypothetical protein
MSRSLYYAPGVYRIRVAGRLDARWADRFGGMTVAPVSEGGEQCAELTGYLTDQSALYGVLNTLYDYHYPLLYVEYLGPAHDAAAGDDGDAV